LTNTSLSGESVATRRADTFQAYAADREKTLNKKQLARLVGEQKAEGKRAREEARTKENYEGCTYETVVIKKERLRRLS
jgi:hypothetical protein